MLDYMKKHCAEGTYYLSNGFFRVSSISEENDNTIDFNQEALESILEFLSKHDITIPKYFSDGINIKIYFMSEELTILQSKNDYDTDFINLYDTIIIDAIQYNGILFYKMC